MNVIIGTRGSKLALAQAEYVKTAYRNIIHKTVTN